MFSAATRLTCLPKCATNASLLSSSLKNSFTTALISFLHFLNESTSLIEEKSALELIIEKLLEPTTDEVKDDFEVVLFDDDDLGFCILFPLISHGKGSMPKIEPDTLLEGFVSAFLEGESAVIIFLSCVTVSSFPSLISMVLIVVRFSPPVTDEEDAFKSISSSPIDEVGDKTLANEIEAFRTFFRNAD